MRSLPRRAVSFCRGLLCILLLSSPAAWAGPHQHGVVYLDLAQDGPLLTAQLRAPLESLLGFERAPRTAAERQAASDAMEHLRQPGAVLLPDAAAACELVTADLQADVLTGRAAPQGGHAELSAQYQWRCAQPDQLRTATVQLFDRYRRTSRVVVQVAGPRGQSQATLRAASRTVQLNK
jgi:hypothetical protein